MLQVLVTLSIQLKYSDNIAGGATDHMARECTQPGSNNAGGYGGNSGGNFGGNNYGREKECYQCGGKGHFARYVTQSEHIYYNH